MGCHQDTEHDWSETEDQGWCRQTGHPYRLFPGQQTLSHEHRAADAQAAQSKRWVGQLLALHWFLQVQL